jgi:hypothetical protein
MLDDITGETGVKSFLIMHQYGDDDVVKDTENTLKQKTLSVS